MKHARRFLRAVLETIWIAVVLVALVIWVLPDFFPKRRRK